MQVHRPVGEQRRAADHERVAVDDALDAEALAVGEALDGGQLALGGRGLGDGLRDRVLGGVLERADEAQRVARGRRRRPATTSARLILPVVTVPVLSSTTVSTRRVDSRTSGPLMSRPSCAPRPVPTISAVGVASPSAHGQAMISTATAAVNAKLALSPVPSQKPSVATASPMTIGHEHAGDAVGEALHRRLAGLRVGDELGDLRERGVGADLGRADDEAAAGVDGRAGDLRAGGDLDGHGLAGEHAHVDGGRALLDDAVGGDLLAGAHDEALADARAARRGRASRGPRSSRTATSLAPSSSSAFSAAPARRLARASK